MKANKLIIGVVVSMIFLIRMASGAHYVVGYVHDALDGTKANGYEIVLWNPTNGIGDNVTDIIGPDGNSGADNIYFVDCEMLNNPCDVGDELKIKVLNNGSGYNSEEASVIVTGAGYDVAPNLTLNSPPGVSLVEPINGYNGSTNYVNFSCFVSDVDSNLANVTLYGSWGFGWHANESKEASGSEAYINFSKTISEGRYEWNCLVFDNLSSSRFSEENYSFTIDTTHPIINEVKLNFSGDLCEDRMIRVECNISDELSGIREVIIRAIAPSGIKNYSGVFLGGNVYYADILINETGEWNFSCIGYDYANNLVENESTDKIYRGGLLADLVVFSEYFLYSESELIENYGMRLNLTIFNRGCQDANNFLVGFYEGDPSIDGMQIGNNLSASVVSMGNLTINTTWNVKIGDFNIFSLVDVNKSIEESNESNNKVNKTIHMGAWQNFYGNISIDILLSNSLFSNISLWTNTSSLGGNVFFVDKESVIDWMELQAIGKNVSGSNSSNDFSEIDEFINMSYFSDSVSQIFSIDGSLAKATESFYVHEKNIDYVPIINSTLNSPFISGILWDMSDDTNGEFDYDDKEDIVFVTKIKRGVQGGHGIYDYEINIPARIREYNDLDVSEVYVYFDLA